MPNRFCRAVVIIGVLCACAGAIAACSEDSSTGGRANNTPATPQPQQTPHVDVDVNLNFPPEPTPPPPLYQEPEVGELCVNVLDAVSSASIAAENRPVPRAGLRLGALGYGVIGREGDVMYAPCVEGPPGALVTIIFDDASLGEWLRIDPPPPVSELTYYVRHRGSPPAVVLYKHIPVNGNICVYARDQFGNSLQRRMFRDGAWTGTMSACFVSGERGELSFETYEDITPEPLDIATLAPGNHDVIYELQNVANVCHELQNPYGDVLEGSRTYDSVPGVWNEPCRALHVDELHRMDLYANGGSCRAQEKFFIPAHTLLSGETYEFSIVCWPEAEARRVCSHTEPVLGEIFARSPNGQRGVSFGWSLSFEEPACAWVHESMTELVYGMVPDHATAQAVDVARFQPDPSQEAFWVACYNPTQNGLLTTYAQTEDGNKIDVGVTMTVGEGDDAVTVTYPPHPLRSATRCIPVGTSTVVTYPPHPYNLELIPPPPETIVMEEAGITVYPAVYHREEKRGATLEIRLVSDDGVPMTSRVTLQSGSGSVVNHERGNLVNYWLREEEESVTISAAPIRGFAAIQEQVVTLDTISEWPYNEAFNTYNITLTFRRASELDLVCPTLRNEHGDILRDVWNLRFSGLEPHAELGAMRCMYVHPEESQYFTYSFAYYSTEPYLLQPWSTRIVLPGMQYDGVRYQSLELQLVPDYARYELCLSAWPRHVTAYVMHDDIIAFMGVLPASAESSNQSVCMALNNRFDYTVVDHDSGTVLARVAPGAALNAQHYLTVQLE